MLRTRKTNKADYETIYKLRVKLHEHIYKSNPMTWRVDYNSEKFRDKVNRETDSPEIHTIIAEVKGVPLGYISSRILNRGEETPSIVGIIGNIWVEENQRGKGIATRLVKEILDYFEENKAEEVTLAYVKGNVEAEGFWEKLGFKPVLINSNVQFTELKDSLQSSTVKTGNRRR